MWGEVSAGVNFFNPSANTSVFAKVDVTFGDNIDGVGGKAGMRASLGNNRLSHVVLTNTKLVMAGLVRAIHVFNFGSKRADARHFGRA